MILVNYRNILREKKITYFKEIKNDIILFVVSKSDLFYAQAIGNIHIDQTKLSIMREDISIKIIN